MTNVLVVQVASKVLSFSWPLLKVAIAIGGVFALFYSGMIRLDSVWPLLRHHGLMFFTAFGIFCTLPLGALRWKILLSVQGVVLPFWQVYHISAIGAFAGALLPGIVGGDALRFIYVTAAVPRRRAIIGVTLLADRLLGLTALLTVAIALITAQWTRVMTLPVLAPFALLLLCVFALASIGVGVAMAFLHRAPTVAKQLHHRGKILRVLGSLLDVAATYRRSPAALLVTFLLSLIIQAYMVGAIGLLADAMKLSAEMNPLQYALSGSLSTLAGAVPVTPGGIGVGEVAFDHICKLLNDGGAAPFASAFFAFRGISYAVLLVALPSFILYRQRRNTVNRG